MNDAFNKADQKLHPVDTQWHYPILTKYGYQTETPPQRGFSRRYLYEHPTTGRKICVTTGCNSDYWDDLTSKEFGYWSDLEPHLKSKE